MPKLVGNLVGQKYDEGSVAHRKVMARFQGTYPFDLGIGAIAWAIKEAVSEGRGEQIGVIVLPTPCMCRLPEVQKIVISSFYL